MSTPPPEEQNPAVSLYGLSEHRFTETYGEKVIRKCEENPLVPIGTLATTGALIMSAVRLRKGTPRQFQHWLRARVVFQALTILAVCGGVYQFGQSNLEENQKALQIHKQMVETKARRDRDEFDERMKKMEEAQKEEDMLLAALKKRKEEAANSKSLSSKSSDSSTGSSTNSWSSWFGWSRK